MSKRCRVFVFDNQPGRYRKCKNEWKFNYNNNFYCTCHFKIYYEKYIIFIQKIFRGNHIRKKMVYYKKLPEDIQLKILKYSRQEFNYKKCILSVVINKVEKFISNNYNNLTQKNELKNYITNRYDNPNRYRYLVPVYKELLKIFDILIKYESIMHLSRLTKETICKLHSLLNLCYLYIYGDRNIDNRYIIFTFREKYYDKLNKLSILNNV